MSLAPKPEATIRDYARTIGDATVQAIPFVGGSVGVLLDTVLRPHYQKRLDAWLLDLGDVVRDLENRTEGFDVTALGQNELFVTAVIEASRIALGSHLETKVQLLKSALLNVAEGNLSDDFLALRYMRFIEELAPEHFRLLAYAVTPSSWHPNGVQTDAATPRALIDVSTVGLDYGIVDVLLADLTARGLVDVATISGVREGGSALVPFATAVGAELVRFVTVFE